MNKKKATAIIFGVIAVLITVLIFANSEKPAAESAAQSGEIVETIVDTAEKAGLSINAETLSFIIRKLAHFAEYFLLGLFSAASMSYFGHRKAFFALIFCLAVAICDEFAIQSITEGRSPEIRDCLIDMCGALTAAATIYFIKKRR